MYYSPNRVLGLRILVLSHKSQNTWSRDSQMQIMRQPRFWSLPISTGNSKYILRLIKSHFSYSCYRTEILLQAISANVTIIITEFYFIFLFNQFAKKGRWQHNRTLSPLQGVSPKIWNDCLYKCWILKRKGMSAQLLVVWKTPLWHLLESSGCKEN